MFSFFKKLKFKNNREIWSWALYDWANSAYTTSVMTAFFPPLFKNYWNSGVDAVESTARLANANSISSLIVVLLGPILGSIADSGSARKKFLLYFTFMGSLVTVAMYFISQGNWQIASVMYILGSLGFKGGIMFSDSLIKGISRDDDVDLVSTFGYSIGYLGGGLLLAANVLVLLNYEKLGIPDEAMAIKINFVSVGIWWAVFTIPLLLNVKEQKNEKTVSGFNMITGGFSQLFNTFREIKHLKMVSLFLLAYWFYIDAVDTVIVMAVDYGMSIGFKDTDLIPAILIVQFVAFPAALGYGYLGSRIGVKKAIFIAITVYLFVAIWAPFMVTIREFYILAVIVGLFQGGIQALSRSFFTRLIPENKAGEFFGFYNMLTKFAAILGPQLVGWVGIFVKYLGYGHIASRVGIVSLSLLLLTGAILFYFVDEEKGRKEAEYLSG